MRKFNYENEEYLSKLGDLNETYYSKYIKYIEKYSLNKDAKILDVGCGNGIVLEKLKNKGYKNEYGIDISKLFVKAAKRRGLQRVFSYDGSGLPFRNNFFDLIGSFNVLEHTEDPEAFLTQQLSKLKKGGYIIVACPNFLSVILNSPHPRIKGVNSRIKNVLRILWRLVKPRSDFEKMPPIFRKKFQYDDDAIVATNLIDLKETLKNKNCNLVYESGFINYDRMINKILNTIPVVRYALPSCFIVARKR